MVHKLNCFFQCNINIFSLSLALDVSFISSLSCEYVYSGFVDLTKYNLPTTIVSIPLCLLVHYKISIFHPLTIH